MKSTLKKVNSLRPPTANDPIDKGFAWVVLLSCGLIRMWVDGFWSSLGIFYVAWQYQYGTSATSVAWTGFAFMLILFATGPFAAALAHKYGFKVMTIFAGLLTFISLVSLSFVSELWHIFFIFPFCGMGLGIAYNVSNFYVHYFDKRFAVASLLNASSSGIGLFVIPPLLEILNRTYGINGTLFISAALMLNICVYGMFFRPPKWEIYRKPNLNQGTGDNIDKEIKLYNDEIVNMQPTVLRQIGIQTIANTMSQVKTVNSSAAKYVEKSANLDNLLLDMDSRTDEVTLSPATLKEKEKSFRNVFRNISDNLNLSLFLDLRFLFQGVLTPLMYGSAGVVSVYMVPYGVDAGVSTLKAALLVSLIGMCIMCIRISPIGLMVDKKLISPSLFGGIACIIGGFFIMAFPFTKTYFQMIMITVGFGISVPGIGASMYPLLVRNIAVTAKRTTGAFGYTGCMYGIGAVTGNLLTGFIHDLTDSYVSAYLFLGGCIICMGISMLLDSYLIRWQSKADGTKAIEG